MAKKVEEQDSGAIIYQISEDSLFKSNIYCETPYCSPDSERFIFAQINPKYETNRSEFVICEIGTWKMHIASRGESLKDDLGTKEGEAYPSCSQVARKGMFYFPRDAGGGTEEFVKLDLTSGKTELVCSFPKRLPLPKSGTVSPDGRLYAFGMDLVGRGKEFIEFGIELVDLKIGGRQVIDSDNYLVNPYAQFDFIKGRQLLIQHNRRGMIDETGKMIRLVGPEGATLYLLDIADGKRTPLKVGKPYTTGVTGHEAWIGNTKEVLFSVQASGEFSAEKGNLLAIKAGEEARVVSRGYDFNHVGTSFCGRFYCSDDWRNGDIIIGSILTGKCAILCHSKSSLGRMQNTHPHGYLTPDLKWVIFNSDRTGTSQIYAAKVPEEMIEELGRE